MADNMIFDMNGVEKLYSDSRGEVISFGAYNGNMQFSVFRGNGTRPSSVLVTSMYHYAICQAMVAIIKGGPSSSWPIKVTKYDPTLKKRVPLHTLNFGKDANGVPFIEYTEEGQSVIRFTFNPDKNIEYGAALSDTDKSNDRFKAFYDFVSKRWPHAPFYTRNNLYKKGQGGGNRQASRASISQDEGSENDIY